jgi:D-alanyl-D-alanine dipeptidase
MAKLSIPLLLLLFSGSVPAQQLRTSAYGVSHISDIHSYRQTVAADSQKRMLRLQDLIPAVIPDLRYATTSNFTGKRLYPPETNTLLLRSAPARALQKVANELAQEQMGLKIFDAYRPYSVTITFWELIGDERYVAHPSKASNHNRGLAVDLTLVYLETKKELPMGTGFDHFSDTAHHSFLSLPPAVLQNRMKLKSIMEKYGFRSLDTEWWHYTWPNDRAYEVLDLPFRKLNAN